MNDVAAIILAAGKGTRMKSSLVKVLHRLGGEPMIRWPETAAREAGASRLVLVIGHQCDDVRELFAQQSDVEFALQEEQLGTGHAVACATSALKGFKGEILILCGDVPLIQPETLKGLLQSHRERKAVVTVLTTHVADPFGYGRIIKREGGKILRIVEEKDATEAERGINEVNSGIYCVDAGFLFDSIGKIGNDNAQSEYYLTDIVKIAADSGGVCIAYAAKDPLEVMGVNDRAQLAVAEAEIRRRVNRELMLSGVTLEDPSATYIEKKVAIGNDTVIEANVHISGNTRIGSGCRIETGVVVRDSSIGNGVVLKAGSVIAESIVHDEVAVGPMAHLRPGSELMEHVKIGNFVETKKIVMGEGSKASHLTYLGDATIGANVNIGCGTITCNYDGVRKHRTVIEDDVFIGSDVQLVAPVTVRKNALVAAGTTVTTDVPPDSLAIARTPQVNKEGWRLKKK